jgi:hypothetical protein
MTSNLFRFLEFRKRVEIKENTLIKLLWSYRLVEDSAWENRIEMRWTYPELFEGMM